MTRRRTYSLHISAPYFRTLRGLSAEDRRALGRILRLVQLDPSIDGFHKILLAQDAAFTTYVGADFYVFYFVDRGTIFIMDAERI